MKKKTYISPNSERVEIDSEFIAISETTKEALGKQAVTMEDDFENSYPDSPSVWDKENDEE